MPKTAVSWLPYPASSASRTLSRALPLAVALAVASPACSGEGATPPTSTDAADDSEAPEDSSPPEDLRGEVLVFVDFYGLHVVDLRLGTDTRITDNQGATPYLSPDSRMVLHSADGAGLTSELVTLDGALVEDLAGTSLGWVGPEHVAVARVDPEALDEGPVYTWNIPQAKEERVYNVEGHQLLWGPHGHFGEAPALVLLDQSAEPPTLISVELPDSARSRELSLIGAPALTVDARVTWLDEAGELWTIDPELRVLTQLTTALGGLSVAPWVEPGQVLLAYDSGEGRRVRLYDLDQRELTPIGEWAEIEGFDPHESRVQPGRGRVAFRIDDGFYLADLDGTNVELVAEGFGDITGWDW